MRHLKKDNMFSAFRRYSKRFFRVVLIILRRLKHSEPPDPAIDTSPTGPLTTRRLSTLTKKRQPTRTASSLEAHRRSPTLSPWGGTAVAWPLTGIQLRRRRRPAPARSASTPPHSRRLVRSQHRLPLLEAPPLSSTTAQLAASRLRRAAPLSMLVAPPPAPSQHRRTPLAAPSTSLCSSYAGPLQIRR